MELTRRDIFCGCISCAITQTFFRPLHAQDASLIEGIEDAEEAEDALAICSTDEDKSGTGFTIENFSSEDRFQIDNAIKEFKITDYGTAALADRWRKSDGLTPNTGLITLGCFFMSGSERQKELVRDSAQGWLQDGIGSVIRFDFTAPREKSQIRIKIAGRGNNSAVGRGALGIPKNEQTMNLVNINRGTIQHEFGHALGMLHEHMHPGFTGIFNETQVIREMSNIWDEDKTRRNILKRLGSNEQCVGDSQFNPNSIMMYNIPKRWTTNGKSFRRANKIQSRDIACIKGLYGIKT